MKKLLPIALILIVLAGIGWYLMSKKQDVSPATDKSAETAMPVPGGGSGVIGSIKDAMGLGQKMKCTYSAKDGSGASSTVFVDGKKFKFTTDANGEKMYGVFDGETQYMWTTGAQKQGFKMTKVCTDELAQAAAKVTEGGTASTATPQDLQESFDTAQNVQCEAASGEDFSIPTDITFVDQCEMIKNSMKALEEMKGQLPADIKIPGY
ncbi:MAG: hypothetical protein WAW00_00895 [Candidatus Moraniibacteriota bacterium]